ncbi:glycosyltransferase [Corynebacterium sp.]|uniref:glycosyltransferase n=1 Tax=Corynebacterium sp. TaxID=1720 RepID=UPI0034C6803E
MGFFAFYDTNNLQQQVTNRGISIDSFGVQPTKILFVINSLESRGNGLAASARQTIAALKERGFEVRTLAAGGDFNLPVLKVPLLQPLISSQGYIFAKTRRKTVREAVAWADIVHLEEPFLLQAMAAHYAQKLDTQCVATYHLHPENMTASVYLEQFKPLNQMFLRLWQRFIFDRCAWVQCPSENVRIRLQEAGFRAPLKVISNGVKIEPLPEDLPEIPESPARWTVICVGRFSREKDQKTLLQAMRYTKAKHDIQLIFAGQGPTKESLQRLSRKLIDEGTLRHAPQFKFFDSPTLTATITAADLYIHPAFIEVEGMSCMEALRCGVTPIIAEAPLSATSQFAISTTQLFPARNPQALARRIDDLLGNAPIGTEISQQYTFDSCVDQLVEAYHT